MVLKKIIHKLFSLQDSTDIEGTIDNITQNISIRGTNMWMLISSCLLASVGLDMNSGAILIGAMLISPLMSPILGMGFSLGTHDRKLFFIALNNLIITVVISLIFSAAYFYITPLGEVTEQLQSRTSPTLLDAMVAIFGGVAGIIACSRTKVLNAIPGVAIATALMPPLCAAGYGIAKGDFGFFMGAFYLFFINAVFIAVATYFMVQLLGFPHKHFFDDKVRKKVKAFVILAGLATVIPSMFILFNLVKEQRIRTKVTAYVNHEINTSLHEAVEWKLEKREKGKKLLKVYMIGAPIMPQEEKLLKDKLISETYALDFVELQIVQVNVPKEEGEKEDSIAVKELISALEEIKKKDDEIAQLKLASLKIKKDASLLPKLNTEVSKNYPEVDKAWYGMMLPMSSDEGSQEVPTLMVTFKKQMKEVLLDKETLSVVDEKSEAESRQQAEENGGAEEDVSSENRVVEKKMVAVELESQKRQDIINRLAALCKFALEKDSLHILEYDPTHDLRAPQMEQEESVVTVQSDTSVLKESAEVEKKK